LQQLEPASLVVRQGGASFAQNRRKGQGGVDHDVPILEVRSLDGKPRAILFGYACHNLTLPPSSCRYCGDYCGYAQAIVEQHFRGAIALFMAGAGADQDPVPRGTLELAQAHGRALAEVILQKLAEPGRGVKGKLRVAFAEAPLDFRPLPSPQELEADLRSDDPPRRNKAKFMLTALEQKQTFPASYPCPVHVVQFGSELLLIALGGEPVAEFARRFKSEFSGPLVWVAGYSNDTFGYVPTRQVQREGGYEGNRSVFWSAFPTAFTETVEERVTSTVRRLVERVRTSH
jgi:hypothetical protein